MHQPYNSEVRSYVGQWSSCYLLELEVLEVKGVGEHHEEQADEDQVEHEPGDQESTPPGAQPVGRQAVTGIEYRI